MKLDRKKMLLISFMLFSLFFGAGNLIFPPFLGQNAGSSTVSAMLGFLATAVILPVLGVIVVARFDGLEQLAQHAGYQLDFSCIDPDELMVATIWSAQGVDTMLRQLFREMLSPLAD